MLRCFRILANGLALFCFSALCTAQTAPPDPSEVPLEKEGIEGAARVDTLSIPTPGELLAALNKLGKLDWSSRYRPPISTNFSSRPQMALNLGGLIADGYIAVEAQDAQQVKNIGKDIVAIAKPLGVQQEIINRGKSLTDFATENKWDVLKEELEATQNEAKNAMADNKDPNLVTLVTIGAWLRATDAISGYLVEHYTPAGAKLLRQPAIVHFLNERLDALPEKMRDDWAVKKTRGRMVDIETAVSFPRDTAPSVESVKKLNALVSGLLKDISRKDPK
ncbi:MAG: hypothetical protein JWL90_483 [Chthoniobacteraceae bacterium]|nr:hypothetical protein [Chthoniobacteraceae bacterium]